MKLLKSMFLPLDFNFKNKIFTAAEFWRLFLLCENFRKNEKYRKFALLFMSKWDVAHLCRILNFVFFHGKNAQQDKLLNSHLYKVKFFDEKV